MPMPIRILQRHNHRGHKYTRHSWCSSPETCCQPQKMRRTGPPCEICWTLPVHRRWVVTWAALISKRVGWFWWPPTVGSTGGSGIRWVYGWLHTLLHLRLAKVETATALTLTIDQWTCQCSGDGCDNVGNGFGGYRLEIDVRTEMSWVVRTWRRSFWLSLFYVTMPALLNLKWHTTPLCFTGNTLCESLLSPCDGQTGPSWPATGRNVEATDGYVEVCACKATIVERVAFQLQQQQKERNKERNKESKKQTNKQTNKQRKKERKKQTNEKWE